MTSLPGPPTYAPFWPVARRINSSANHPIVSGIMPAETRADTRADRDTHPAAHHDDYGHPQPGTDGQCAADKGISPALCGTPRWLSTRRSQAIGLRDATWVVTFKNRASP